MFWSPSAAKRSAELTISYPPSEILFVDDLEENINAAQSLGLQVHHFRTYQALQKILE